MFDPVTADDGMLDQEVNCIRSGLMSLKKIGKWMLVLFLIVMSFLASAKMMILGLNIDEEYAITMGYRMALGDRMFLEMWEPHQMSAFVCAFLVGIYKVLFHTKDYLVLYLRGMGVVIQLALSIGLYRTIQQKYSRGLSFWAALLVFNAYPKWTLIPEFSNLFLWCNLATMICLCRWHWEGEKKEKRRSRWLFLGAFFYCGAVLCYPSAILMAPVYLAGLYKSLPKRERKIALIFPLTCVGSGTIYVGYFLSHMTVGQFLFGIRQMMTDGVHSYGLVDRLLSYGQELIRMFPWFVAVLVPSLLLGLIFGRKETKEKGRLVFVCTLIGFSCLEQFLVWISKEAYLNTPLILFYTIFLAGFICPHKEETIYRFGYLPSLAAVLSVLLLTNTDIGVSGMQLLPGMICSGLFLGESMKLEIEERKSERKGGGREPYRERLLTFFSLISVVALFLFAKGWLVCETGGYKADALFVKQKALYGVAKNIYCRYLDGYDYNRLKETLDGYVGEEDAVLYVGKHSLRYLLTDAKISNYSTISTPTFDDRLKEYWEQYPERYPTVIIVEPGQTGGETICQYFELQKESLESEKLKIYFTKNYSKKKFEKQ